jgi:DNA-binding MarR family transcriptional regulator
MLLSAADLEPHLSHWLGGETGESNVAAASAAAIPAEQFLREQVTAILRGRALRLMNKGTRRELIDEAAIWQYALDSDAGDALRTRDPELFGCWQGITSLVHDAARRDGTASIEIVLRSHAKHAQPLLKLLAERRTPVPRKELREKLGIEEYQMSHLLSDLEEASLVRRVRQKGMKEVAIELDWAGREAINVPEIEETASLKEKVDELAKQIAQLKADGDRRGLTIETKIAQAMSAMHNLYSMSTQKAPRDLLPSQISVGIPLVGAGMSAASRLPSADELMSPGTFHLLTPQQAAEQNIDMESLISFNNMNSSDAMVFGTLMIEPGELDQIQDFAITREKPAAKPTAKTAKRSKPSQSRG